MRALDGSASYVSARDPSDVLRERARTPERVVERTASPAPVPSSPAWSPGSMADDSAARFRKALDALVYFDADASDARASSPRSATAWRRVPAIVGTSSVASRPSDRARGSPSPQPWAPCPARAEGGATSRRTCSSASRARRASSSASPPGHQRRGHRDSEQDRRSTRRRARTLVRLARRRLPRLRGAISARGRRAPRPICAAPPGARRRPGRPPRRRTHRRHPRRCSRATPRVARPILDDERGHTERGHTDPAASAPASVLAVRPRVNPEPAPSVSLAPAAAESATLLALCGWEVVPTDATPPRVRARWGVKSAVLRCRLCEARDATWNFPRRGAVDGSTRPRSTGPGSTGPGSSGPGSSARPSPRKKPRASGAALIGALGGRVQREHPRERDGAREFGGDEAPRASPGLSPGLAHLGFSIAGGASPSAATRAFGGAGMSPPRVRRRRDARIAPSEGLPPRGRGRVSLGPGRPSAREGDARPRRRHHPDTHSHHPDTHRRHHPDTHTHRARASRNRDGLGTLRREAQARRRAKRRGGVDLRGRPRASSVGGFHPIRRHRAHCPWIVVHADVDPTVATGGSLPAAPAGLRPGWLCVLDAVAPAGLGEDAGEPDVSGLPSASGEGGAGAAARGEGSPRRRGNSRTFPCTEGARRWRRTSRGTGEGREAFAGEPRETDRTREEDSKKSCHEVFLMLGTAARSARARPAETHVIPRIRHLVVTPRYDARDDGATHAHAVPRGDPFLGRVARARRRRAGSRGGAGAFRGDEIGTDRIARFEGRTRDRRSRGVVARRRRARGSDRGGTRVDGRLIPRGGGRLSR